jgi:hypothetical protein
MSLDRRTTNPGKREREARKRLRRGLVWSSDMAPGTAPLKLGHEHIRRWAKRSLAVADSRKGLLAKGVEESGRQHEKGQDLPGDFCLIF